MGGFKYEQDIYLDCHLYCPCYTEHTLNTLKQFGIDHKRANKLARKLHAQSVMYANKLVTTGRAIENKNTSRSQVMEPGASNNPPDPH
eukprot:1136322-Pelagomonas_calceolata.AAC.1